MNLLSWGMFPKLKSTVFSYEKEEDLVRIINEHNGLIPYGNGRSYGDSALSSNIIDVRRKNYFIDFDDSIGLLNVQAGVLLSDILETFVPRGWFLKITPGTKFITVGGAVASDVHGKNHHVEGCFSECVKEFRIMLADGSIVDCSKEITPELFRATCGGMGLTGVILDVKIYLKKIKSKNINQITIKTKNLKETFKVFEEYRGEPYSVAWIDCLARGEAMGRCLLTVGRFSEDGELDYKSKRQLNVPFIFPSFVLSNWGVRLFNWLYYNKVKNGVSRKKVELDTFFYPLDKIGNWNRIYGNGGFTQYQFIIPKNVSYLGIEEILTVISESGMGSFLAVIKLYGKENDNYLSFPMEGYSLALDFKIEKGLFELLNRLDEIVVKYQGRIYLAKDVRVNKKVFENGYQHVEAFRRYRKTNSMGLKFESLQSKRIGI